MKKNIKNNKGFAITSFLYAILVVFLVFLSLILVNIINSKLTLESLKKSLKKELEDTNTENNYAELVIGQEVLEIAVGQNFDLLGDVYLKKYNNDIINADITYDASSFNKEAEGTYVIAYSTIYEGKTYNNHRIIKVVPYEIPTEPFVYSYTGSVQQFTAEAPGYYKIELWGASGGDTSLGGKGAYSTGTLSLNIGEKLYIYVGGTTTGNAGGYNGGGNGTTSNSKVGYGGGGATDIRYFGNTNPSSSDLVWNSTLGLNSRIMIAGGGGGGIVWDSQKGGAGGGLSGISVNSLSRCGGVSWTMNGGTQTTGYSFGIGGTGNTPSSANCGYEGRGGGGGGYYGGYAQTSSGVDSNIGGAGGSSYISGYKGSVAITSSTSRTPKSGCANGTTDITCSYHYSGKIFTETQMIAGNASMPNTSGGTETGHSGNGYAKITYIKIKPKINFEYTAKEIGGEAKITISSQNKLSNDNQYKYYLSTSSAELVGGSWKEYENGEIFDIAGQTGTYYLWIYPVKDILGNISDNKTYGQPYLISEVSINGSLEYAYSGTYKTFEVSTTGIYNIQLWGSSGATDSAGGRAGKGGYTSGNILLNKGDKLYIYVGKSGATSNSSKTFNGGGGGQMQGGGATDVRYFSSTPSSSDLEWNSTLGLNSRIMVAGGGAGNDTKDIGGDAGGLSGSASSSNTGKGGTQTAGGDGAEDGGFGYGGGNNTTNGGGGGGYYGGGNSTNTGDYGGGGGSSYISGHTGCVAITSSTSRTPKSGCTNGTADITCSYHYSNKIFTNTQMIAGNASMPNTSGGTETGHSGNGYAKITFISLK